MSRVARYPVPASRHRVEQVVDRSRFICTVEHTDSVEAAQAFIREVSNEFPDATHNCWAYVVGAPGSTSHIGMSDAGEPHGTAGRPMLTVLLHSGVGDVAAVVTRYFGGTKLGTGGLVRAYGGAVQEALDSLPRAERVERTACEVRVSYADLSAVQQLFPRYEAAVSDETFAEDVRLVLQVPEERMSEFVAAIGNATRGQAVITQPRESA